MDDPPGVRAIIPFRATAPGDAAYNAQSVFRALFRLDNSTYIIGQVISYKNNK